LQNLNIIAFFSVLLLTIFVAILLFSIFLKKNQKDKISTKLDAMYFKLRNDINFAVAPYFINLSPSADDFMQFAVEVWRIEQRVAKLQSTLSENQKKGFENSIQKLKRYFEKYDIEILDYTNQKFNDGLNLDVLSVEKDSTVTEPIIKETVEPTVLYRGQVVRKAKIIVITK